ncbi:MAG: hypothetical protein FWD51_07030, partial [Betaproteobacteria bacterium]|nr:hypothetical protein [Betaproteobacteria bacterium]
FWSGKNINLRKSVPFVVVIALALAFALGALYPPGVFFGLFVCYALSGYVLSFWRWRKRKAIVAAEARASELSRLPADNEETEESAPSAPSGEKAPDDADDDADHDDDAEADAEADASDDADDADADAETDAEAKPDAGTFVEAETIPTANAVTNDNTTENENGKRRRRLKRVLNDGSSQDALDK